jgi:transposase InsO family protein
VQAERPTNITRHGTLRLALAQGITPNQERDRLQAEHVVAVLNRLVGRRGAPRTLFADTGAEFTGHLVHPWAYRCRTQIDFLRPGKPIHNASIKTINGSLRDECLNLHWLDTMAEARSVIEAGGQGHSESRPHMALGQRTPPDHRLLTGGFTPANSARTRRSSTLDHLTETLQ